MASILETVADRSALEQVFHDVKEVHGAGQQQLRHVWANVGAWNLIGWWHTLVELWAWDRSKSQSCNRSDSPWDKEEASSVGKRSAEHGLRAASGNLVPRPRAAPVPGRILNDWDGITPPTTNRGSTGGVRQIQRQPKTNLTIAKLCRQLGVSVPTFYYWKRRVQAGPRTPSGPVAAPYPIELPATAATPFVPVSIVNPDTDTYLELELANACVVRLRLRSSPRLLRVAITAVGSLGSSRQGAP